MSKRSFTKKEQTILKENKYTYSVAANTISYTIEFKNEFWKRYQTGQLPREIIQELGYDLKMIGETRLIGLTSMIKKQAQEGNFREGQHACYKICNHPDYSSIKSSEQKLYAMEHELYYLRHEMEFLKKISNPGKDIK